MPPFLIQLVNPDGSIKEEISVDFEHDDAAIEHAGWIDHPHGIDVFEHDRLVARFPPEASVRSALEG